MSCEYYIKSCDVNLSNCIIDVVSLTDRSHNWSFEITAGVSPYHLEGAGRYYIYSEAIDSNHNSATDYKALNFDFTPPTIEIK